jgi:hypothetical protein
VPLFPLIQNRNYHNIWSIFYPKAFFISSFSTFNSTPEIVSPSKLSNASIGLNNIKTAQKQSKMIAQTLGSVTVKSRVMQILHIVLEQYAVFLEKSLVDCQPSEMEGLQSALDFIKSEIGRRFLVSYIYKGFSLKSATIGTADLRLIKFAGSVVELLPAFCMFLETGITPESAITARSLLAMAKEYHSVTPELSIAV